MGFISVVPKRGAIAGSARLVAGVPAIAAGQRLRTNAAFGEIDVTEAVNLGDSGVFMVSGIIYYGGQLSNTVFTNNQDDMAGCATAGLHDYALERNETEMRWYVDSVLYAMHNSWYTSSAGFLGSLRSVVSSSIQRRCRQ